MQATLIIMTLGTHVYTSKDITLLKGARQPGGIVLPKITCLTDI